jgi:hypothetical protein
VVREVVVMDQQHLRGLIKLEQQERRTQAEAEAEAIQKLTQVLSEAAALAS